MSEGEFHAYVGLLVLSAVVLAVMATRGFGQTRPARIVDAVFAAGFLGYAAYLAIADPATVTIFFYAFAVPVLAVVNAVRARAHRRGGPVPAPLPYAGPTAPPGNFPPAPGYPGPAAPGFPAALPVPGGPGLAPPPGAPVPSAGGDFQSAAALFAPPKQPGRPEPPSVDPGTYSSMPSGLAGHEGHEHAMPGARPSGLPAAVPVSAPATPSTPETRPSGLPRRTPTHAEAQLPPSPAGYASQAPKSYAEPAQPSHPPAAHVEFTQRLSYGDPNPVLDEPAGPQPLYPAHPGAAAQARDWRSDLTQQFPAAPGQSSLPSAAQQFAQPAAQYYEQPTAHHYDAHAAQHYAQPAAGYHEEPAGRRFEHAPAQYFERAQAGHAAHARQHGHAAPEPAAPEPSALEPAGHGDDRPWAARHGYQEQTGGGHRRPEPFGQAAYRPAHGGDAYGHEPGPAEPQEAHPAEWPPYPR